MNNDIANAFWYVYGDLLTWIAAGTSVGGIFIALFWAFVSPIRRRLQ